MPRVTIGIPVYNGEQYLQTAIDSALSQTFEDLELIISDNASTDATAEICREYAAKDPRVRYFRNESNVGAAKNFNRLVHLSHGEYFKWLASDEAIEPRFLEVCVQHLDSDPGLVLACTNSIGHDELNHKIEKRWFDHRLDDDRPHQRFRRVLERRVGMVLPIWGLMRLSLLKETHLIRSFVRSDHCLIVELALVGRFSQSPEHLAHIRSHANAYHKMSRLTHNVEGRAEAYWFDPENVSIIVLPHWRRLKEYAVLAIRADETVEGKAKMLAFLSGPFVARWSKYLVKDVVFAFGLGGAYVRLKNLRAGTVPAAVVATEGRKFLWGKLTGASAAVMPLGRGGEPADPVRSPCRRRGGDPLRASRRRS